MTTTLRGSDNFDSAVAKSMIRLNTPNGYGSTNTVIRRFTNVVETQGTDITYTDSATAGASFTVNSNGIYAINYVDNFNTANSQIGISKNSSQLTTAIASITISDILAYGQCYAINAGASCSNTLYLTSGSVIRPHTSGNATGAVLGLFTITKVF